MRILGVTAIAFGPFEQEELELAPGMNVVTGPNESGKSSWHAALYAALCGMRRARGRARVEDQAFRDRHRPWQGDRWEVSAVVRLSDGRTLELRHDLDGRVDSRITDLGTGADVSGDYVYDGAPDGAGLLGLARDIVPSTLFVRQADIFAVTANAENLQEQLQRAAATSGRDATAEEALRRIEEYRREHVGSAVPHATRPLRRALCGLENRTRELEEARARHEEYLALAREARESGESAGRARAELRVARALKTRTEADELAARLERAEAIARERPAGRPTGPAGRPDARNELRDALAAFRGRPDAGPLPEGPSATELEHALEALPDRPSGDIEVHDSVAAAAERWRERIVALETCRADAVRAPAVPDIRAGPAELRRLADDLEVPLPDVDPALLHQLERSHARDANGWVRGGSVAGAVVTVAGLALIAGGQQLFGLALAAAGVAGLVVASAWRRGRPGQVPVTRLEARVAVQREARQQAEARRARAVERTEALGLAGVPQELRQLARALEGAESDKARHEQWQTRVSALEAGVADAALALRSALTARGAADADDSAVPTETLLDRYRRGCREQADRARLAARREPLESALAARRASERSHEEAARKRAAARDRLRRAAAAAGIDAADPDELAAAAERWLREEEARAEEDRIAREGWAMLDGILEGRTLDALRVEVASLSGRLPPLPENWRELGGADLLDRLDELERDAEEKAQRADHLQGRMEDRARNLPAVAAAEEALEKAREELERVRRLDLTLERTLRFLGNARDQVQRAIAPRLREAVERRLPRVTGGRYAEALVDPDSLQVRVRGAGGEWREAALLSHGTAEQVYLLLRIGLVEFIATTGEPAPLILDEVTVQSDVGRAEAVLDTLLELSAERQIILFSQEQQVLEWARRTLVGETDRLIELGPEPVPA